MNAGNVRTFSNSYNFVFCATKWSGFADEDIGVAAATLQDVSNFPKVADRTQQGFLNQLFLARLVKDPNGFASERGVPDGRRRDAGARRHASSTTATARAASSVARSPRSRRTGPTRCSACRA